jgi:acetyltransferase-like isoleucine patch superfamily enzyme
MYPSVAEVWTENVTHRSGNFLAALIGRFEFFCVFILASTLGIDYMVRYLRNPNPRVTSRLIRAFGSQVGMGTTFKGRVFVDNVSGDRDATGDLANLKIGSNCYIGDGVFFDLANRITLGDNSVISGGVSFITHAECNRSPKLSQEFARFSAPINVGSGAWLGFQSTILAGVNIGENTAIGADSLVLKATEPNSVYVGVPARIARRLD